MSESVVSTVHDMLWGVWHELGVPGTVRLRNPWIIDLELLVIYTPFFASGDPRLDEMAFSWCEEDLLLHGAEVPEEVSKAFWMWSAELRSQVRINWIDARQAVATARHVRRLTPDLSRPALTQLRARAVFGVGARADIICALLHGENEWLRARDFMEEGYSKNAVASVLTDLTRAGLVSSSRRGNADRYNSSATPELSDFLGARDARWLSWKDLFHVITVLTLLERHQAKSEPVRRVEASRARRDILTSSVALGWSEPPPANDLSTDPLGSLLLWGKEQIETCVHGR
jgi:DNA-binding transcriptional ArsR family regulator